MRSVAAELMVVSSLVAFQGWFLQAATALPSAAAELKAPGAVHWAFQPVVRPTVPRVTNARWSKTPIDRFLLSKLEEKGLTLSAAAKRRVLIRRATFDLIGLPPSPAEVAAFLEDRSPQAFERVVDRLLASPQYGERWGRFWLDLARYADTAGDSADYPIPQSYLYRNYVVDSFNGDKPYALFLREQVAGDLMPCQNSREREERIIATGYLALARRFGVAPEQAHHLTIEDTLDTLGRSVLGLSLSCARCHDHKHDPIPTRDYYALYGIFSSTRYPYAGSETQQEQKDLVPLMPPREIDAQLETYRAQLANGQEQIQQLQEQLQEALKKGRATTESAGTTDGIPTGPSPRELNNRLREAKKRHSQLLDNPPLLPLAFAVAEGQPSDAKVQIRGEPDKLGEKVPRGFLTVLGGQVLPKEERGSGRLQLAEWLTAPKNPLTARVMVNRIWQHHFGRGLVGTPSDFGTHGQPPSHPELLDYLAWHFVRSGGSIKSLHRLIMLSQAYQQASAQAGTGTTEPGSNGAMAYQDNARNHRSDPPRLRHALALASHPDPENKLLWRFPRLRLDAESIRDSLLVLSGELDSSRGGPHPFPPETRWDFTQHKQFTALYETRRRSIYLMTQRLKKHPFFALFDGPDANASTAERPGTITPLQALFAMNDPFLHEQAEKLAARLLAEGGRDVERIEQAYQLIFSRSAQPAERRQGEAYLQRFGEKLKGQPGGGDDPQGQSWASYIRTLLASNEFLFVD